MIPMIKLPINTIKKHEHFELINARKLDISFDSKAPIN